MSQVNTQQVIQLHLICVNVKYHDKIILIQRDTGSLTLKFGWVVMRCHNARLKRTINQGPKRLREVTLNLR